MIWEQHPHDTVLKYIDLGYIRKPHHCENCGKRRIVVAHHEDYFKPIDIVWLCKSCHRYRHSEIGHGKHWKEINKMFPKKRREKKIEPKVKISLSVDYFFDYQ